MNLHTWAHLSKYHMLRVIYIRAVATNKTSALYVIIVPLFENSELDLRLLALNAFIIQLPNDSEKFLKYELMSFLYENQTHKNHLDTQWDPISATCHCRAKKAHTSWQNYPSVKRAAAAVNSNSPFALFYFKSKIFHRNIQNFIQIDLI